MWQREARAPSHPGAVVAEAKANHPLFTSGVQQDMQLRLHGQPMLQREARALSPPGALAMSGALARSGPREGLPSTTSSAKSPQVWLCMWQAALHFAGTVVATRRQGRPANSLPCALGKAVRQHACGKACTQLPSASLESLSG